MFINTCSKEHCKFHQLIGGDVEHCPMYVKGKFTTHEDKQEYVLDDCFPKRQSLQLTMLTNTILGLQKDFEGLREEINGYRNNNGILIKQLVEKRVEALVMGENAK